MNLIEMTENQKLRKLRKILEIPLDIVASETGISAGFINRFERGYIKEIKNEKKKIRLEYYIKRLEERARDLETYQKI